MGWRWGGGLRDCFRCAPAAWGVRRPGGCRVSGAASVRRGPPASACPGACRGAQERLGGWCLLGRLRPGGSVCPPVPEGCGPGWGVPPAELVAGGGQPAVDSGLGGPKEAPDGYSCRAGLAGVDPPVADGLRRSCWSSAPEPGLRAFGERPAGKGQAHYYCPWVPAEGWWRDGDWGWPLRPNRACAPGAARACSPEGPAGGSVHSPVWLDWQRPVWASAAKPAGLVRPRRGSEDWPGAPLS